MPVFDTDNPDLWAVESEEDIAWLRSLARIGYRAKRRAEKRAARPAGAPITEEELCALLSISRKAIKKLREDPVNPIPHRKVGRRFLYAAEKVDRWAEANAERLWRDRTRGRRPV